MQHEQDERATIVNICDRRHIFLLGTTITNTFFFLEQPFINSVTGLLLGTSITNTCGNDGDDDDDDTPGMHI